MGWSAARDDRRGRAGPPVGRSEDDPSRTEPDVWAHRDLMPGNLLAADGRLTGVIDVGTFTVADPRYRSPAGLEPSQTRTPVRRSAPRSAVTTTNGVAGWAGSFRPGDRLYLVLRRDRPGHVSHCPPHADRAAHCRVGHEHDSFPGRSGASRTSSTTNPTIDSSTSAAPGTAASNPK